MVQDLRKRFSIKRRIWVSDAGLLSDENLEFLEASRYEYILGMARGGNRKDLQEAFRKTRELEQKEFKQTRFLEVVLLFKSFKNRKITFLTVEPWLAFERHFG